MRGAYLPEDDLGTSSLEVVKPQLLRQQDVPDGLLVLAHPEGDADGDDRPRVEARIALSTACCMAPGPPDPISEMAWKTVVPFSATQIVVHPTV